MVRIHSDSISGDVAEIQGLYGAFSFPEKLLQRIWMERAFQHELARSVDGRRVRILHPGKWNLLGGPDFRVARLHIGDGPEIVGDVELHLRAQDWEAHAHARDPAYNNVVLHVVLFWPEPGHVTHGADGREIPVLPLLPLLHHDLEEYAADEAVEALALAPAARVTQELGGLHVQELRDLLERQAGLRWRQKVHFARLRIQRLGWEEACHQAALEVLGFRYNRAPMLRVATRWPLAAWSGGKVSAEEALASESDVWSVQGVRPANHPHVRLLQYQKWTAARPDWPRTLAHLADKTPPVPPSGLSRPCRRLHRIPLLRKELASAICGNAVAGTRMDNLVCDAFLPLLGARAEVPGAQGCWFHWFCGDLPPFVQVGMKQLAICDGREQPACHGLAQGLLGWAIEREVRR